MTRTNKLDELNSGLASLQNKFREMESQIKLGNDDSVQTIKMQRQKIKKLRENNKRIKDELEMETRNAKRSLEHTSTTNLVALQEQGDYYERKIQQQKRIIIELEKSIKKVNAGILQQRSDMGGVNANRETSKTIQKNIRMLENRLDKASVKYNESLGHNKKLRQTIDNLRRDRSVFDGIYSKLQSDLETKKAEMGKVMDDAMIAYEERVSSQVDMIKLKELADKEMKLFDKEWNNLNSMIEENHRKSTNEPNKINSHSTTTDPIVNEEKELKKRLTKASMQVQSDKIEITKLQEKIEYYRTAFEQITNNTGLSSIDELVKEFENSEKTNFGLFNESNNLDSSTERVEHQIQDIKKETQKIKESGKNNDTQRNTILEDLKIRISDTQAEMELYNEKQRKSTEIVNSLTSGVIDILKIMNAERVEPDIIERAETVGINETNLMEYLAVIEKRTNQLVEEYLLKTRGVEKADEFIQPLSIDQATANSACMGVGVGSLENTLVIVPPTTLETIRSSFENED